MFLHFPTLDTLRLALTSGAIPEAMRATSARFGFDDDGSLWMQPTAVLTDKVAKALQRLGGQFSDDSKIPLSHEATHWLQMIPLMREVRAAEMGDKTPVLFELPKEGQLAELALEILRLGNDRQSFRWLDDGAMAKAILRVVGPPYYSLLRAIDREGQEGSPIAYREVGPGIWVQVGYSHPLGELLKPPTGQWLLLRSPHQWAYVPEAKLHDIYEVIDFQLPGEPTAWHDRELPGPIHVSVKLTRRGAAEAAELWVLREAGIVQLEEFVRASDNALLGRLAFAGGEKGGQRIVVLRVRPSKASPPVLVLDGIPFRSYLRIPNLFLPIGQALHPPLRRDAVVKLLASDSARVTWLMPSPPTPLPKGGRGEGTFTPESLPDDAFRPLSEWIDYVLEHEHLALAAWLGATQFQFEGFICKDDVAKQKKPAKEPIGPKPVKKPDDDDADESPKSDEIVEKKKPRQADANVESEVKVEPGELERRLRVLEKTYSALKTPLEDPDRQALWREMAKLNGALNHPADMAICWSNALWESPSIEADGPREWLRLETKQPMGKAPAQLVRILQRDAPTHADVRQLAASLIWAAALPTPPADLLPHLGVVQQYLVKHESHLGVRTAWLAWHALYRIAGNDVLMLARARDRMLERLYLHGLTPELDLPGFLRFSGLQASSRFRLVRDQVVRLRTLVQEWAKRGQMATTETHAYIDLIFAFGLARLGETIEARNLLRQAAPVLANADEIHSWLYAAFEHRVQQALDGKQAADRLPDQLLDQLAAIENPDFFEHMPKGKDREEAKQKQRGLRLKIDRFREKSRILEPREHVKPYDRWHGPNADALTRELARLSDLHDRGEIIHGFEQLLGGKRKIDGVTKTDPRILIAALDLAPRLGQAFGEAMLDRVPAQLAKAKDVERNAEVLEKSVFLAAHYDRKDDVERLVAQLQQLLQNRQGLTHEKLIRVVAGGFRSLRKLGLRDAVAELMQQLGVLVQAEKALHSRAGTALVSDQRSKFHCLLLELAASWFFFGDEQKARKILDDARDLLMGKELYSIHQAELAAAYLTTLGQAPMDFALARIMEFFRKVEGVYDLWQTTTHFSLSRVHVVEAMMLAIISDDFMLDPEARKRLDDDEFLVRRRIHRDVRAAMG